MPPISRHSPLDAEAGARLVSAPNAETFSAALLEIARTITDVEELFGYIVLKEEEPKVLLSKSMLPGVEERVRHYVHRFYRHDPAVKAIRKITPGDSFVQRISLSDIIPHDYRTYCFTQPGFTEKLSFGWRSERYILVISFYGMNTQGREALAKLANLASMALAVLVRQYAPVDHVNAVEIIEGRLRRTYPGLSRREAEICALTMIGWSSARIADKLGISSGTVLTYRQRAYQKTRVTSAAELVVGILN